MALCYCVHYEMTVTILYMFVMSFLCKFIKVYNALIVLSVFKLNDFFMDRHVWKKLI